MVKRNLILLIFLISITARTDLIAQTNYDYFPHSVDNVWQYMYNDGRLFQEKIVRDSIDNFGNLFLRLWAYLSNILLEFKLTTERDSIYLLPLQLR